MIARSSKQPLNIGYILAGVVSGPHTGLEMVPNTHEIGRQAEIGVALVLLAVKLELSVNVRRATKPWRYLKNSRTSHSKKLELVFVTKVK